MRISVCLDRYKNNSIDCKISPLSQTARPLLWVPRVWNSLVWNQIMAENYLNSYFKNSYSRESNMAGFAVEHALTKHYHEGLKRGATRNTLVRLSCALERLFINLLQFHFLLNELELTVTISFIQNALCFTNKNAISQITVFLYIHSIFPDKSEKYFYCLWFDFQI